MGTEEEHCLSVDHSLLRLVEDRTAIHMPAVWLADEFQAGLGPEVALVTLGFQNFLEEVIVLLRLHFLGMFCCSVSVQSTNQYSGSLL